MQALFKQVSGGFFPAAIADTELLQDYPFCGIFNIPESLIRSNMGNNGMYQFCIMSWLMLMAISKNAISIQIF